MNKTLKIICVGASEKAQHGKSCCVRRKPGVGIPRTHMTATWHGRLSVILVPGGETGSISRSWLTRTDSQVRETRAQFIIWIVVEADAHISLSAPPQSIYTHMALHLHTLLSSHRHTNEAEEGEDRA